MDKDLVEIEKLKLVSVGCCTGPDLALTASPDASLTGPGLRNRYTHPGNLALSPGLALCCAGSAVAAIAQLLQKLYFLQQPLLSRHSTAALAALCASSQVPPEALSALLAALLDNSAAWQAQDADTALSLGSLMETGLIRWLPVHCFAEVEGLETG